MSVPTRTRLTFEVGLRALPLVQPFQVSHMTTETVDIITLRLLDPQGAEAGRGEISADAGHGQDGPAIAGQARELTAALAADPGIDDPARIEAALAAASGVSGCVRTLVEMAFLDRAARLRGEPVWALLRLPEPGEVRLMTTVPINEELPSSGLLKIKLGGPGDAAVLRRLAAVDGPIVLDVNRGWGEAEWTTLAPLVAALAPAVIEDPVNDPGLLPRVRAALPRTAVVLDEGIAGQADVEHAIEVAGGANVKVMKLGGLFPARQALTRLAQAGATRMLGCYLEPPRAIAYSAQLAGLADWTDLDGHFWLCDDPKATRFRLGGGPGIPNLVYDT